MTIKRTIENLEMIKNQSIKATSDTVPKQNLTLKNINKRNLRNLQVIARAKMKRNQTLIKHTNQRINQ